METGKDQAKNLSSRLEAVYERVNKLTFGFPDILRTSFARFSEKQGIEGAASIAFFTVFALPPLMIVTVTIGSFFLENLDIQALVLNLAEESLPIPADVIIDLINEILTQRTSLGIIGLVSLAWSAGGVLMTLSTNVNRAWSEAKPRNFLENRLVALGILGALTASLVIISILIAILNVLSELEPQFLSEGLPLNLLSNSFLFLIRTALFLGLYLWIPTISVRFLPALIAAIIASIGWELTTAGFGFYMRWGLDYYNFIYGSLGTLVAAMFWVYLNSLIIVYGAHLCAAIMHHQINRQLSSEAT